MNSTQSTKWTVASTYAILQCIVRGRKWAKTMAFCEVSSSEALFVGVKISCKEKCRRRNGRSETKDDEPLDRSKYTQGHSQRAVVLRFILWVFDLGSTVLLRPRLEEEPW